MADDESSRTNNISTVELQIENQSPKSGPKSATKSMQCSTCGKNFVRPKRFATHELRCKLGLTKFVCKSEGCGKIFDYKYEFENHNRIHTGEKPFSCSVCSKTFRMKMHLINHTKTHSDHPSVKEQCDVCGKVVTKGVMKSHLRLHTNEKPYMCGYCGVRFRHTGSVRRHVRIHTGEKPFQCKVCNVAFADRSSLMFHGRIHTGERPYPCPYCNNAFQRSTHLKDHMTTHSSETPYSCNECGTKFKHKKSLQRHMKAHQGIKQKSYRRGKPTVTSASSHRETIIGNDSVDSYDDDSSNYAFDLPDHDTEVTVATSIISPRKASQPMQRESTINFQLVNNLKVTTTNEISKKQRKVSKKPRPYVCQTCGDDFPENRFLVEHTRKHTGEKPYQCEFCPEKFRTFAVYKRHRMVHTGERPYKCKYCVSTFKDLSGLIHHERGHTGVRPYKCEYCDKAFTRSTHLSGHYVTHSNQQLYGCDHCGQKFKYRKTLKRHMTNKHR